MSKRTSAIVIAYLGAALVFLGGFAAVQTLRLNRAERAEQRLREHALEELYAAVAGMDTALEKSLYALTPEVAAPLCAELQSRAQTAASALGVVAAAPQELETVAAFLTRTGDYAAWLLRCISGGEGCGETERENLRQLHETAGVLSDNLARLRQEVSAGSVALSDAALEESARSLGGTMAEMEREFPEFPTLVYDGPFSAPDPEALPPLSDAAEISREQALLVGAAFLNTRPNLVEGVGRVEGTLPVWRVRAGDYTAHISVQGGHALRIFSDRQATRTVLTTGDALAFARQHLEDRGFRSMKESYYIIDNNIITVTYCRETEGILCYPDMVKVAVFLDTGELAGLDAESYVRSHRQREFPPVSVGVETAREQVSAELRVLSERLALIPSHGGEERLCHEFICENEQGRHCLIYVSAVTGRQEKILLLREDETGTLAI